FLARVQRGERRPRPPIRGERRWSEQEALRGTERSVHLVIATGAGGGNASNGVKQSASVSESGYRWMIPPGPIRTPRAPGCVGESGPTSAAAAPDESGTGCPAPTSRTDVSRPDLKRPSAASV